MLHTIKQGHYRAGHAHSSRYCSGGVSCGGVDRVAEHVKHYPTGTKHTAEARAGVKSDGPLGNVVLKNGLRYVNSRLGGGKNRRFTRADGRRVRIDRIQLDFTKADAA